MDIEFGSDCLAIGFEGSSAEEIGVRDHPRRQKWRQLGH